jgi:hypothetical protein
MRRLLQIEEIHVMVMAHRLLLITAVVLPALMLAEGFADAQTLPWPSDPQPQRGAAAPWPGERPAAPTASVSPMMGSPMMMGAPPQMGAPRMGGGGGEPPCMADFVKMREEVEKKGKAAKAAGQKHASREEMCKLITSYAASEEKWVKFTEAGVGSCGIPPQIAGQLKQVHAGTEKAKEKICTAGPAGPAAGPSLSEALSRSTQVAAPDASKAGMGICDTLAGSAVCR